MRFLSIALLLSLFISCTWSEKPLLPVKQGKELVVLTINSPTTFFENAEGNYAGLEHDLAVLFAKELGVTVKFVVVQHLNEVIPNLVKGKAHVAAAGLSLSPHLSSVKFSVPYQIVQPLVVYHTDQLRPKSIQQLSKQSIEVVAGAQHAVELLETKKKYPKLKWKEVNTQHSDELIQKIYSRKLSYTIVNSHELETAKNFYPKVDKAFNFSNPQALAWAFPTDVEQEIYEKSQTFFIRITKDGTLQRLIDRYYGHINRLEPLDVVTFLDRIRTKLPRYKDLFFEAQELTDIDWRLLAAIGYQESHWNPLATSPTGVRGIMMLTEDTADFMKVNNRLDPKESILAGARYFWELKDKFPERIPEPDRTWLALAAYNIGFGHLEDARILAVRQRLNPDSWTDVKKTLPLLTNSKYFSKLKHGFARGGAPVVYVENIRTYYDIMVRFEKPYQPLFPPSLPNTTVSVLAN